jgi:hypothetical protein
VSLSPKRRRINLKKIRLLFGGRLTQGPVARTRAC